MEFIWTFAQQLLLPLVPTLLVVAIAVLALRLVHRKAEVKAAGTRFREQLLTFFVLLAAVLGVLLTLPLASDTRGQLLTLLGLLLTAVVTLSSSTVAANAMAGVMLRSLRSYTPGDFISVGDHFGRVTEQDLFHTEIQTQDRDLLALPNLYLATNPVKVVHAGGTIVSAEVSLGYDIDHRLVEELLVQAAEDAQLEEPFVYVTALGDFSVVYRVSGFLAEVKHILSVRSNLHKKMMDRLHAASVEIVSPNFMNQRQASEKMIPQRPVIEVPEKAESTPEKLIFDKADRAQQIKDLQNLYEELEGEIKQLEKATTESEQKLCEQKIQRQKSVERALGMLQDRLNDG